VVLTAGLLAMQGLAAVESIYKVLIIDRRWFTVASAAAEDYWSKKMYYFTGFFTYNAFLAIIALLVALSALMGVLADSRSLSDEFVKTLKSIAPIFGATPEQTLSAMKASRSVAGVAGVIGLLWTGTRIFGAIEWGFSQVWGSRRRSFARKRVFGLLLVSVIGLLFLAAFLVQFGFNAFWNWAIGRKGVFYQLGSGTAKLVIGFAVNFILFAVVYRLVPTVRNAFRDVAAGAAVAAALFLGTQYLLAFYFGSISNVPSVYGSISTVLILLVWLHVTGMITFFGAEIIHVMQDEELLEAHRGRASAWSFVPASLRLRVREPAETGPSDGD